MKKCNFILLALLKKSNRNDHRNLNGFNGYNGNTTGVNGN